MIVVPAGVAPRGGSEGTVRAGIEGGMRVMGRREGRRGILRRTLGAGLGGGGGGRRLLRKGVRGGRRGQRGLDAFPCLLMERLRC